MAEHVVNGKKTKHGDKVHYCGSDLVVHEATIQDLKQGPYGHVAKLHVLGGANSTADLEEVPFSDSPAPHSWNHFPDED